jgi:hypothetical protein
VVTATDLHGNYSQFYKPGAATFPFRQILSYPHEAEWTPLKSHYFSENLVAQEIETGISGSVARNSDN